jgi:two-component system response regulator FixJ
MTGPVQVHIIDDDEAVRESLAFLLSTADLFAATYASPTAFLAASGALADCCVITDVRMPEMNGLEMIRRLRQAGSTLPVIVITGHRDVPLALAAMKAGALDMLEKPFEDEAILAAIRCALAASACRLVR